MSGTSPLPTLSQIQAWETEHLSQAATRWDNTADAWEGAFDRVAREINSPGGSQWEGSGAEHAQHRAASDQAKVRGAGDDLRTAAASARNAVDELDFAKRQALYSIGEAHAQGFIVSEDLSVRDRQISNTPIEQAARQIQAEALAADIRSKAGLLLAADQEAAARITTAAAGLSGLAFPESSGGAIQAVDFKQAPPEEPTPEPTPGERHPEYEDRKPNGEWAPGNSGIDGDAEAHRTFDEMEENGIPVIRDKVAVRVVDPENGHTYTRYYDGLRPTGRPGEYIGIEHKVNKSPITSNQQTVDDLVRSGVPATGKLNGEPIIVSDVQVIRVERAPVDAPVVEGGLDEKVIEFAPKGIDNWGTEITPEQMEDAGFPWNVMEKFLEQSRPHDSKDPKDWA